LSSEPAALDTQRALPDVGPTLRKDRQFGTQHLLADLRTRSVQGGAITLSSHGVRFVIQTGTTAILGRLLTPSDFGLFAMVVAVSGLIGILNDFGFARATVQRADITHAQVSVLFWINLLTSAVLAVLLVAAAPAIAVFYDQPRLTAVAVALAPAFILGALSSQHYALLERQMRFGAMATIQLTSLATGSLVAILLAWYGAQYWSLVAMSLATGVAVAVMSWGFSGWVPSLAWRNTHVRPILRFGAFLTGSNLIGYLGRNVATFVIGRMIEATALGLYSKAYGLVLLPINQLNGPLAGVVLSALGRLQNDAARYRRFFLRALGLLVLVGMPMVGAAFSLAEPLVLTLLGPQWKAAVPVFRLLAPAAWLATVGAAPMWLAVSLARTNRLLICAAVELIVSLAALLIAIPWGIQGAAVAASISAIVMFPLSVILCSAHSPVTFGDILQVTWQPTVSSVLASLAAVAIQAQVTAWPLLVQVAIGLPLYACLYLGGLALLPGGPARLSDLWTVFWRHICLPLRPSIAAGADRED
jgi:O-antigen/teichoic acid export membrane protein